MAENLTPKKYIDSSNMKQILAAVKNEIPNDNSIITTEAEYLALPEEEKLNNSYYLYDIGVHYKNGVAYSRKEPISLTMEEYKALGEVDPDQEYIVSADAEGILLEASDIGYSNAVSNLPCTTVQGAIDKVVESGVDKYSTDEVKTNKVWIDGKPIYRRVVQVLVTDSDPLHEMIVGRVVINQLTTDGTTTEEVTKDVTVPSYNKQVDLSSFNIKRITGLYGSAIADSGRSGIYCPCDYGLKAHCHIYYSYNNKLLHFRVGEQYATSNTTWDVVLEYTKTTD